MAEPAFPNPQNETATPDAAVVRAIGAKVEAAGGKILPEPCIPEDILYKIGGATRAAQSCGCHNTTRMAVLAPGLRAGGPDVLVTLCAVCDSVPDMPNFGAETL